MDAERFVLGITGGTGCGKTTLLKVFESIGGLVLDCDAIYHELLTQDASLLDAIDSRFPSCVEEGKLNRKALAAIVFNDPAALADLNAITHGAVKEEVLRRLKSRNKLVAIDAIGLFEGGLSELCDAQKPEAWFREHCDFILENNEKVIDFQEKCLAFFDNLSIIKEKA